MVVVIADTGMPRLGRWLLVATTTGALTMGITMYGADWCGDCRRSKTFLIERGIEFDWVDLEARPEEIEQVLSRNDGRRVIPTIVFEDGSHLTEPTTRELAEKLGLDV